MKVVSVLQSSRFSCVLLLVVLIVMLTSLKRDRACETILCRGDFPAFWAGAVLADSPSLYNPERQREVQRDAWPSLRKSFLYFAYPPYTAISLSGLRRFPPKIAKGILVACSICALFLFARFLPREVPVIVLFVWSFLFPQNFIGVLAGQNVAFSMLLVAILLSRSRDSLRGVALGLLWFKPQFAIVLALGCLVTREVKILAWSVLPCLTFYIAAALVHGWQWPLEWIQALSYFVTPEYTINAARSISIFTQLNLLTTRTIATIVTALLYLGLIVYSYLRPQGGNLAYWVIAAVLLTPRTMFYDFGVVLPALIVLSQPSLALVTVVFLSAVIAATLGPPLEPYVLTAIVLLLPLYQRERWGMLRHKGVEDSY